MMLNMLLMIHLQKVEETEVGGGSAGHLGFYKTSIFYTFLSFKDFFPTKFEMVNIESLHQHHHDKAYFDMLLAHNGC